MTTTESQTLRLTGPAELLTAVPYLLGFHPRESLVLVGLAGRRLIATARTDLADVTPEVVSDTIGKLQRSGATAVTGIIVTDQPTPDNHASTCLIEAAGCVGLQLRDVLLVTGDRWRSLRCTGPACCPRGADPCRRQPRRGTHPARCPASR
jgi:hypothetical protein